VRVVVVDRDHTPLSRALAARVDASPAFTVGAVTDDERVAERAIDAGAAELVLVVPEGSQRGLARRETVALPVWVDGTDTNRGLLAQSYLDEVVRRESAERLGAAPLPIGVVEPRVRVLFNPALQSRWFMLPALVVMVLTVITLLLSALAVVKEREQGTIEQLVVTPIRPIELILGKLLPFVGVGGLIATLVSTAAIGVFGLPLRGSPLTLVVAGLVFLMSTLGLGLLASTVSRTQQQAMLAAMLILLPSFLLGGVFYPTSNMPDWAQALAALTPIRYFVVVARSVFLKGADLSLLLHELAALAVIGAVVLTVATLRFQKRSA
jgi:ABC-2 type transport system permease protein